MGAYPLPAENKRQSLKIDRFGGVDFLHSGAGVDKSRSPDALNMTADEMLFPAKRCGYLRLHENKLPGKAFGLHRYTPEDGTACMLAHFGSKLYKLESGKQPVELYGSMWEAFSDSFMMNSVLYLLDGNNYLQYDGRTVQPVRGKAKIPVTRAHTKPDGTALEQVETSFAPANLLTPKRQNTFWGDGSTKTYQLDALLLDNETVTVYVNGAAANVTVDRIAGTITFATAPPAPTGGRDNVIVTFEKSVRSGPLLIPSCRFHGVFGGADDMRVFLSGHPYLCNAEWCSAAFDPTYFPEDGYRRIGSDNSAIVGYLMQYDKQIVLKQDNGQDAAQYLRTFSENARGESVFTLRQGAAGIGAVSWRSMAVLEDTPLFLSEMGVYALTGTGVSEQRRLYCVSRLLGNKLPSGGAAADCTAAVFGGKFYLATGDGACFVADSRMKYRDETGNTCYEWQYWEGIPARTFLQYNGALYFSGDTGYVYRFAREEDGPARYSDDGRAIPAKWTTPYFDFDAGGCIKTVENVYLSLPHNKNGGCSLFYLTEQGERQAGSFATQQPGSRPKLLSSSQREKNCRLFAVRVENDAPGEGLGLLSLQVDYTVGRRVH